MQPSLLAIRAHLRPLSWLLGLALLVSVSPHLAQGLVLCFGDGHVEVEASGLVHHAQPDLDADAEQSGAGEKRIEGRGHPLEGSLLTSAGNLFTSSALEESGTSSCIDVPLRAARGNDLCHQAVMGSTAQADLLLPEALLSAATWPLLASTPAAGEAAAHPVPSSDVPAASSPSALGSVVLLI